ncbi:DUF6069 family protein [Streptomyces nanshensis]|uniref:Uncharacterized protein n=1 Tax=Streptomyces nanshensis TaxID=518642 RepID=A0A1E7KZD4_9ACTN|nr:DUF6069 family protein [Streptomyces nanshensis]OEV09274.1 hypothetical protein AN218_22750 [Streptomyces nanshensis]
MIANARNDDTEAKHSTAGGRIAAIASATVAAVAVWLLASSMLGIDITAKTNGTEKTTVGVFAVIVTTLLSGLLGWGLLAVLERITGSARTVWTTIAVVVFLLSLLLGPASGVTTGAKGALAALHTVAALVLIPGLARNSHKD